MMILKRDRGPFLL